MAIKGLPQYRRTDIRRHVAEWECYDDRYSGFGDTKPQAFAQWKAKKAHQPQHMRMQAAQAKTNAELRRLVDDGVRAVQL